jgi:hypothetical protein
MNSKRKGKLVPWVGPAKRPEAFGFALIFFVTFLHQGKKVKKNIV